MPAMAMLHETDPRDKLWTDVGDLTDIEVFNNQVLVAIYLRPNKTRSGIILADVTREEDKYQGKIGMVIKKGASAFDASFKEKFSDIDVGLGDWIVFRPSDGWQLTLMSSDGEKVPCRILDDTDIRGRIQQPDQVW